MGNGGLTQLLIPVWSGTTTSTKGLGSFLVRFIIKTCFWWLLGQQKVFLAVIQLNSFPLAAILAQYLQIQTSKRCNSNKDISSVKSTHSTQYAWVGYLYHYGATDRDIHLGFLLICQMWLPVWSVWMVGLMIQTI